MRFFRSAHRVLATQPTDVDALVDLFERVCGEQQAPVPTFEEVASWLGGGFELYHTAGGTGLVGAGRLRFSSGSSPPHPPPGSPRPRPHLPGPAPSASRAP